MKDILTLESMNFLKDLLNSNINPVKEDLAADIDNYFSNKENLNISERLGYLIKIAFELDLNYEEKILPIFSKVSRELALVLLNNFNNVDDLEDTYKVLVKEYKESTAKVPYALVEALKYAHNKLKAELISEDGLVILGVAFFKESHRAVPNTPETPLGEHAPVEKLKDILFLIENSKLSVDFLLTDDSISEKKDIDGEQNTTFLYKRELLKYLSENLNRFDNIQFMINNSIEDTPIEKVMDNPELFNEFSEIILNSGKVRIIFTSIENEVQLRESRGESDLRSRIENRNPETNKITERKGGGVLINFEREVDNFRNNFPLSRIVRVLSDADRAFPEASFLGDAAYAILEEGSIAYLADLKDQSSLIVGGSNNEQADQQTALKIKRRKLFLSGFLIPTFFAELKSVHNYNGTTQLPAKAVSAEVDFKRAQLETVQPNVDLGLISVILKSAEDQDRKIASGPILNRENVASSTMTSTDTKDEWEKTYGPIFKSVPNLVENDELTEKYDWIINFLEKMDYSHYDSLFNSSSDPSVNKMFDIIETAGKNGGFKNDDYLEIQSILSRL